MRDLKPKHAFATLSTLAFALLYPVISQAQTRATFDLGAYLNAKGLDASDIQGVVPVAAPSEFSWSRGHSDEIRDGYVTLVPTGGFSSASGRAVLARYNPIFLQPLQLSGCGADGACIDLSVEKIGSGKKLAFTLDGNQWELTLGKAPCRIGVSCEFMIPSWALEGRRLLGSSSLSAFPKAALIAGFGGHLGIFNASSGAHWLDIRIPDSASLGVLQAGHFSPGGRLFLRFAKARMILDFEKDRAIRIDRDGVAVATAGIANLALGHWNYVYTKSGDSAPVLAATESLAVWGDGYLVLDFAKQESGEVVGAFQEVYDIWRAAAVDSAGGKEELFVLRVRGQTADVLHFGGVKIGFETTSLNWPASSVLPTDVFVGRAIMRSSAEGATALLRDGPANTPIGGAGEPIHFFEGGHAFVGERTSEGCFVTHYRQHEREARSFAASGLKAPCGHGAWYHVSSYGIGISSLQGETVHTSIIRP